MHAEIYKTVGPAVMICQILAVLEVLHPLLGWVRTGVIMPFIQVHLMIRVIVLCSQFYHVCNIHAFNIKVKNVATDVHTVTFILNC